MMLSFNWLEECPTAAWLQPRLFPLLAKTWLGCIQLNLFLPADKPERQQQCQSCWWANWHLPGQHPPHDIQGVLVTGLEMPSGMEGGLGVAIYMFMNVPSAAKRSGAVQCGTAWPAASH